MLQLSMSAISSYQRCQQKFSLQYLAGLEDKREKNEALEHGTSLHKLLELTAKGLPWEESPMEDVVKAYLHYRPLPSNIISADDPHFVELNDLNVMLRTTFDLVYEDDNMLVIRDYKGFSANPSLDIERNFQARCYLWAATQIWPDYTLYKFEHEYIRRTPPFVPKNKKREVWFPEECYKTVSLVLSPEDVKEDGLELQEWIKDIVWSIENRDRWRKTFLNGGGYDSCGSCHVRNLCAVKAAGNLDPQTIDLIGMRTGRGILDGV